MTTENSEQSSNVPPTDPNDSIAGFLLALSWFIYIAAFATPIVFYQSSFIAGSPPAIGAAIVYFPTIIFLLVMGYFQILKTIEWWHCRKSGEQMKFTKKYWAWLTFLLVVCVFST